MAKPSLVYSPIFIVVCFIAVLICALGFSRFSQSDESAYSDGVRPLLVETLGDTPATILTKGERYVGRIEAGQRAAVGFDTSGVITAVLKSEGDTFKKGEVLVTNVTKGTACTLTDDSPTPPGFCVIGKSLEDNSDSGIKLVNIVV